MKYTVFILQNILKNVFGVHFNATLNHGNCSEMSVAPVLCGSESVQALGMPAEVLEPHVAGPQSQGEDRTLKQSVSEYCLVLGAGDEDLRLVMDSVALFQKAGVGVPVPEWCDVWLGRDTVVRLDEHLQEKVEVLDEVDGVRLEQRGDGAQKPGHWKVVAAAAGGVLN